MLIQFHWLQSELSNCICKSLLRAKQLHALLLRTHLLEDPFYATKLVRLYAANNDIHSAYQVFDESSTRSVYLWNSIIRAYAQSSRFDSAISLFRTMFGADISPDNYTYACVIRACCDNFDFGMLRLVHGAAVASGFGMDPICCSALVAAYSKLGFVNDAHRVFNGIAAPDLVLWNSLISGYVCSGSWEIGMRMFNWMRHVGGKPDGFTLAGLLGGITDSSLMSIGQGLHGLSLKSGLDSDSHVGSLLVSTYSRCKCMASAYSVFFSIFQPDLVTWSALIAGYSMSGEYEKALFYFRKLNKGNKKPDSVLIASALAAIAQAANIGPGYEIHGYVIRHGFESDVKVSSALVDMYSKCGFLHLGTRVFRIMPERNIVSYNSIISGLGLHGCASESFKMFDEMLAKGLMPDEATFCALLCACCHAGLVKDGREIFHRMKDEFHIMAMPEHYVYMVKLLGSAGHLEEAYKLVQSLSEPVDKAILGALLSCCNSSGNSKMAENVAQQLFESNPDDNAYSVMLSNIYAGDGRWDEAKNLRDRITGGQRKMPGLSWTEGSFC
ncbi:putative pentatricopeptide repeat-containing protein At1g64310 [Arachis stenosperma]|uniref:putative pentatricopeptide repeat-containing protein At1g64310 n=1 Tax=Arachis stenosperma TaxID=217475 RepID=UPI0025AC6D31|nr:putative pentatricopeptide repeat-containing protein At1g64310 [Arachis stenosperma]